MFLNYISGVLRLDISQDLEDKNILIFDDLFASGFTIKEMINSVLSVLSVQNLSPKSLKAVTVFKTK